MSLYNIINLNVATASSTFSIPSAANKSFSIINLIIASNLINTTTANTIAINFATQLNGTGFKIIVSALSSVIQPIIYSASLSLTYNNTPIVLPTFNNIVTYGDYVYITYNNNQWNYISSVNDIIINELKQLGATSPDSESNPLLTRTSLNTESGTNMLKSSLSEYLDGNGLSNDGKLVTVKVLPYDLYKYLDVSFNDKYGANESNRLGTTSGSNKLESIDSLNYLNQFLLIMQNNPTFYQAVTNELIIQNSLNEINIPVNSLVTLTYPTIINKSIYFGDIIIQATSNNNETTYAPIDKLLLDTNSKIIYLGSNIDIQPTSPTNAFKLYYYTTSQDNVSTAPALYNSTNIVLTEPTVPPSSAVSVTFLIVTDDSTANSSTPIDGINGIFLYNGVNAIVQGTLTSLYQSPNTEYAAITYTYATSIISPISLCIINSNNDILYNAKNLIYINTTPPPELIYDNTSIYSGAATITYTEATTSTSNQVYYNAQNLVLNSSSNSITFYINSTPAIILTSIILGFETTVSDSRRPDITTITEIAYTSANLTSASITIYYDSAAESDIDTHILYLYFYSNSTWYRMTNNPIYINNTTAPTPVEETADSSGCYQYTLSTILAPNPPPSPLPTPPPPTSYSVFTNTIVTLTVTTCDISINSDYIFELGYMDGAVFTAIESNLITTSDLNVVSLVLYDYSELPPSTTPYQICVSIKIPPNGTPNGSNYFITTNSLLLIVSAQPLPSTPPPSPLLPSGALISISAQNSVSSLNFPVTGTLQNPYSVTQGNTISFFIYSATSYVESIIYFNGYELTYYTQATDSSNTYFGGSKSYVNTIQLKTPFTNGGFTYYYYTTVSIRMTLPIDLYYITVSNKFLSASGQETLLYSLNNIYLNVIAQTNLVIQGSLVNGIIISPLINVTTPEAYATVNGHILIPNKSLYAYQTKINGVATNGYFYVITGNTIENDSDASNVLSGASQTGLICFEGQGNGTLLQNQTPIVYNSIINNMLLYFKRISNNFGFGLSSEIASILNTKLATVEKNINNVIQNIEYTARNVYLCGMYTTNIYINGNSLPVGTSYYPNGVTYQGPTGSIPESPAPPDPPLTTAPNPDVNTNTGIFYLAINIPSPAPPIGTPGQYWGVNIEDCSTGALIQQKPNNWSTTTNLPSGLTTTSSPIGNFRGVNSFNALNNLFEGNSEAYQIQYSCKNVIIIPSNYIGYGIIDTPQEPSYILSIILNTQTPSAPVNECSCAQSQPTLNGESITVGTEIMIVNNSAMNIRIVSFNTTSSPPMPIQINLKDTTMDTLFIKPAESMHIVFGGTTWGIM
jgi:hypothetical protein